MFSKVLAMRSLGRQAADKEHVTLLVLPLAWLPAIPNITLAADWEPPSPKSNKKQGGGRGEVAYTVPQPGPIETQLSSLGAGAGGMYRASRTRQNLPAPRQQQRQERAATMADGFDMTDIIPDINISKFFGGGVNICGQNGMKMPYSVNPRTGCLSISRKQQKVLKQMLMYADINQVAAFVGLSVDELVALVTKQFPARRRGISAAQLRNAKRVNNQILNMANKLGYKTTPMSARELSCR